MIFRKALRKLNSSRGFTLTETLSTLVIMSLVGLMITAGIVTAVRVYKEVTQYANAQVLLTNTMTLLNDNLIYAKPETVHVNGKTVSFEHEKTGVMHISAENSSGGGEVSSNRGICISYGEGDDETEFEPLVSYEKNEDVYTDWTISASDASDINDSKRKIKVFTITLSVKSGDESIIDIPEYKIQTLNSRTG
ncbi:prepilin-type N-terminal cleavage/methylation domain-containing protein [Lachnospiraceae bacterium JC7]|nr:prepilin-type N-terminal cleavage/methylation domain-containing protein [Lachnospiraceae bacterium JC7]